MEGEPITAYFDCVGFDLNPDLAMFYDTREEAQQVIDQRSWLEDQRGNIKDDLRIIPNE